MPSSSMRLACSMESMPARIAFLMPLCAVRVRSNLPASHVRLFCRGFQLFKGKLRRSWTVSFGEHAACSQDLDHIHAVFHLRPHDMTNLVNSIGDLEIPLFRKHGNARLRRKIIEITMSSGDGNRWSAGHNTRPRNEAFVNGVAQVHSKKRQRT